MERPKNNESGSVRDEGHDPSTARHPGLPRLSGAVEQSLRADLARIAEAVDAGRFTDALAAMQDLLPRAELREYGLWYDELPEGIRRHVPHEMYSSRQFLASARERGMTPYQWAGLCALALQGVPGRLMARFQPEAERGLRYGDPKETMRDSALVIVDNPLFEDLPSDLQVAMIEIRRCKRFAALPATLTSESVRVLSCPSFAHIPDDFTTMDSFQIEDCDALRRLPERLHVGGDFYLDSGDVDVILPDSLLVKNAFFCRPRLIQRAKELRHAGRIHGDIIPIVP